MSGVAPKRSRNTCNVVPDPKKISVWLRLIEQSGLLMKHFENQLTKHGVRPGNPGTLEAQI